MKSGICYVCSTINGDSSCSWPVSWSIGARLSRIFSTVSPQTWSHHLVLALLDRVGWQSSCSALFERLDDSLAQIQLSKAQSFPERTPPIPAVQRISGKHFIGELFSVSLMTVFYYHFQLDSKHLIVLVNWLFNLDFWSFRLFGVENIGNFLNCLV